MAARPSERLAGSKPVLKRVALLAAIALFPVTSVGAQGEAQPGSVEAVFKEWLAAYNSGNEAAIQAFYGARLGDPDAAFALDSALATCGFDPVRVEQRTGTRLSVLLAERCFPALQRLRIELGAAGETRLAGFELQAFALSGAAANEAVDDYATRLAASDAFAGSLLIVQGGEVQLARSFGTLGEGRDEAITLDTPMYLASAGKMFTAVGVLQLVEAGKVDLDAPLGTCLTDYPNAAIAEVTIRQLLQHRGGTGDTGILGRDDGANRARARTLADIIALNSDRPPAFTPGTQEDYSNYGFVLLGAVIERVSGESYHDYIARHVFAPAGMGTAGFPDLAHNQAVATGRTTFFGAEAISVPNTAVLPWRGMPDGGGVASANDLRAFFHALRAGKLLSPAMLAAATSVGETPWYGMGFVVAAGSYSSWGHGGNSYGMDVAVHFFPDVDTTFVCLATRDMACKRLIWAWAPKVTGLAR